MEAAADLELGGLEVDVGPQQAGELAAPQAAGQGEDDHRLDRVAAEGGEVSWARCFTSRLQCQLSPETWD